VPVCTAQGASFSCRRSPCRRARPAAASSGATKEMRRLYAAERRARGPPDRASSMGAGVLARRCLQHSRGRARRDPRGDVREQPRFGVPGRSFMCFCLYVRDRCAACRVCKLFALCMCVHLMRVSSRAFLFCVPMLLLQARTLPVQDTFVNADALRASEANLRMHGMQAAIARTTFDAVLVDTVAGQSAEVENAVPRAVVSCRHAHMPRVRPSHTERPSLPLSGSSLGSFVPRMLFLTRTLYVKG
jgi:hypothetical protein